MHNSSLLRMVSFEILTYILTKKQHWQHCSEHLCNTMKASTHKHTLWQTRSVHRTLRQMIVKSFSSSVLALTLAAFESQARVMFLSVCELRFISHEPHSAKFACKGWDIRVGFFVLPKSLQVSRLWRANAACESMHFLMRRKKKEKKYNMVLWEFSHVLT